MKEDGTLKEKTAKGLMWGGLSNGLQQLLNALFGIFLARILTQADYGLIGMLVIFASLACALQEGGFISALIRKKEITKDDYNAVFWTNALIGLSFYIIAFFSAPLIARFYGIPELTPLARYYFIGFLITSLNVAPRAYLLRNMMVRENAIVNITALIVSGITGIALAANGFAAWGIATQGNVYVLTITLMSYYFAKWRPSLPVDFNPIREMIGFSSKLIVSNVVTIINNNIFSVLLGKLFTPHDVGNYTQANKWNNMGWSFINNMLGGITQPVFAQTQDEEERQRNIFRKLLRFTAFVSFPTMFGLAVVSEEFITILITDKWLESAHFLQILCIAGAFMPFTNLFTSLIISRGHSNRYMWCTTALGITQLIALLLTAIYGILPMIRVYVIISILWLLVWHQLAKKEIGLRLMDTIKDIAPYLIISTLLAGGAILITKPLENIYVCFAIKVVFFATAYCLILRLSHSTIFEEAITFLGKKMKNLI